MHNQTHSEGIAQNYWYYILNKIPDAEFGIYFDDVKRRVLGNTILLPQDNKIYRRMCKTFSNIACDTCDITRNFAKKCSSAAYAATATGKAICLS